MAIQPHELRIGNWIKIKRINQYHKVTSIQIDSLLHSNGIDKWYICGENIEDIEPIPLTPEIVIQAGFERGIEFLGIPTEVIKFYYGDFSIIHFKTNPQTAYVQYLPGYSAEALIKLVIEEDGGPYIAKINYLHQLQNLYFALTQEELPCKSITK
jgi:hypothetical protein